MSPCTVSRETPKIVSSLSWRPNVARRSSHLWLSIQGWRVGGKCRVSQKSSGKLVLQMRIGKRTRRLDKERKKESAPGHLRQRVFTTFAATYLG